MKTFYSIIISLLATAQLFAQGGTTGDLKVTVLDEKQQPMFGAIAVITAGGPMHHGTTDEAGNYTFRALNPGSYSVKVQMTGYKNYTKEQIAVDAGKTAYVSYTMQLKQDANDSAVVVITAVRGPVDPTYTVMTTIGPDQVKHMAAPRGDVQGMIIATCSSCSEGEGGQLVMRGSREGATTVFVDGEKAYGSFSVPALSIEQVSVLSGGIPAEFGDLSGGAVIITTKSYYSGMNYKENMYLQAAREAEARKKKELEEKGIRKDDGQQIIEQQQPVPAPAPVEQPKEGGN